MQLTRFSLFSYGTLQLEKVQMENYGRLLNGKKDVLAGYQIKNLEISDPVVLAKSGKKIHPIAIKTGNPNHKIEGVVFELTEHEMLATDKYEVSDYHRVLEVFESGTKAWVYTAKINQ